MAGKNQELGKNTSSIRQENRSVILNAIRSNGGLSRVVLSKCTGLSKGGITPIIQELMDLRLICETVVVSSGSGRKPILLELNRERCYVVSLDWHRRGITAALVNFGGEIVWGTNYLFPEESSIDAVLKKLKELIEECMESAKGALVLGIGLVVPGPLDYEKGMILAPPNFNGWKHIAIRSILEEEFHLPVSVDNNANAHALAEKEYGIGRDFSNFLHIIVDEGIGGAIIIDRQIYRGARGQGNEFGHMTIDINGPLCQCGNYGCVELYATVPRLVEAINQQKRKAFMEGSYGGRYDYTFEEVLTLLKEGDGISRTAMQREASYLGALCVSLINILEPEAIILGSQLAGAGDFLLRPLQEYLDGKTMIKETGSIPIMVSKLNRASILGGAAIVIDKAISGEMGNFENLFSS